MHLNEKIEKLIILKAMNPYIEDKPDYLTPFEILSIFMINNDQHPRESASIVLSPMHISLRSGYMALSNSQLYTQIRAAIADFHHLIWSI